MILFEDISGFHRLSLPLMMVALSVKISESEKLYPMYMSRLANQRAQSTDMTSLMPLATAAIQWDFGSGK